MRKFLSLFYIYFLWMQRRVQRFIAIQSARMIVPTKFNLGDEMTQWIPINPSYFRSTSSYNLPVVFVNGGFKFGIGTPPIEIHRPSRTLFPCQRLRLTVLPVRCCNWPRFRIIYQWTVSRTQIYLAAAANRFRKPDETTTASADRYRCLERHQIPISPTNERIKRALD